jgi:hypothetical protein
MSNRPTTQQARCSFVQQIRIHELEIRRAQERPASFPVKVRILSLFVVVRDCLRLGIALEPGQVLFVGSAENVGGRLTPDAIHACVRGAIRPHTFSPGDGVPAETIRTAS